MKGTPVPSGYRNKNTKVRYGFVQNPNDPSGRTRVRTEHGKSSFEISLDNLEYVPLDTDEHEESVSLEAPVDMSNHAEAPDLTEEYKAMAPYGAIFHEPVTAPQLAKRESMEQFDYMFLARHLPYNLGQAIENICEAYLSADGDKMQHLRKARFHLADEMQRIN
jgi:hypothetical protein